MKERGGGKECEAPTHLIEISEFTHAAHVAKNRQNSKVCTQDVSISKWQCLSLTDVQSDTTKLL